MARVEWMLLKVMTEVSQLLLLRTQFASILKLSSEILFKLSLNYEVVHLAKHNETPVKPLLRHPLLFLTPFSLKCNDTPN